MNTYWTRTAVTLSMVALLISGCSSAETTTEEAKGATGTTQQNQQSTTQTSSETQSSTTSTKQKNNGYTQEPAMQIDVNKKYTAVMETTLGTIEIELMPKIAPKTVNSLVFLSKEGYFNDLIFHRVVKDFVIQTGDPLGNGTGGPGYQFEDELGSGISYDAGVVAMANAGPNTNGSQFFICSGVNCQSLNGMPNYAIFGKVSKGMEVVSAINNVEVATSPSGEESLPKTPVSIRSVTIQESE